MTTTHAPHTALTTRAAVGLVAGSAVTRRCSANEEFLAYVAAHARY